MDDMAGDEDYIILSEWLFLATDNREVAIEFNGCLWHWCPKCYAANLKSPHSGKKIRTLYQEHLRKVEDLHSIGLEVHVVWECEWEERKRTDEVFQESLEQVGLDDEQFHNRFKEGIIPREALFGSCTESRCV